jgi:hypothetical protein
MIGFDDELDEFIENIEMEEIKKKEIRFITELLKFINLAEEKDIELTHDEIRKFIEYWISNNINE